MAYWVNDPARLCGGAGLIPSLVLLQQWHRLQLYLGFDPLPGNFWGAEEKKKLGAEKKMSSLSVLFPRHKVKLFL